VERLVLVRHMFPNARPTFVAGIGYASRSTLSSLAIVEYLFTWNGAGLAFIYAVANRNIDFAVALVVALASIFPVLIIALSLVPRSHARQRRLGVPAAHARVTRRGRPARPRRDRLRDRARHRGLARARTIHCRRVRASLEGAVCRGRVCDRSVARTRRLRART